MEWKKSFIKLVSKPPHVFKTTCYSLFSPLLQVASIYSAGCRVGIALVLSICGDVYGGMQAAAMHAESIVRL